MASFNFPDSPTNGQQVTAPNGVTYSWDGTKWVPVSANMTAYAPLASPALTGNPTAPTPSYGDNDTSLATTAFVQSAVTPALNAVGRNLIHNPLFNVAQRGQGPFALNVFTLDRWYSSGVGDTVSIVQGLLSDGDRTLIGDETVQWSLNNTLTGNAAAASNSLIYQRIENVRRLAGKTVTLSFWANSTTNMKIGISYDQLFGTGGSPSAPVTGAGTAITTSGTRTRYSVTMAIPSIAGKTLGTAGDSSTSVDLWFSAGANSATRAGNIGVQSGVVNIWGAQLEIGSVMTPLDKPYDYGSDLRNCQRFYQIIRIFMGAYLTSGQLYDVAMTLPVSPRATPTLTPLADNSTGVGARTLGAVEGAVYAQAAATTTASGTINVTVAASADL